MSLSPFVCLFVRNLFFLLVSLGQVSQRCFSRVFQESFKGVSKKFQGYFKEVSRVFKGSFKGF